MPPKRESLSLSKDGTMRRRRGSKKGRRSRDSSGSWKTPVDVTPTPLPNPADLATAERKSSDEQPQVPSTMHSTSEPPSAAPPPLERPGFTIGEAAPQPLPSSTRLLHTTQQSPCHSQATATAQRPPLSPAQSSQANYAGRADSLVTQGYAQQTATFLRTQASTDRPQRMGASYPSAVAGSPHRDERHYRSARDRIHHLKNVLFGPRKPSLASPSPSTMHAGTDATQLQQPSQCQPQQPSSVPLSAPQTRNVSQEHPTLTAATEAPASAMQSRQDKPPNVKKRARSNSIPSRMSYLSSFVSQPNDIEGGGAGNAASAIGTGTCLRDKALSRLHIRHGPFQRNAFHFSLIAAFVLPFHTMPLQIAQQDVDHWCARPLSMGNVSQEQWKHQMIPRGSDGHSNRCRMFAEWNSTSAATVPCSTWDFGQPSYGASIVETFQLVCENDWLLPVSCSMFPIGAIVALLVSEPVADRLGRKPVIKFFVPLLLASVLIAVFFSGLSTFLLIRFLVGVAATTLFTTSFALVVEVLSPSYRTLYSMVVLLGTVFGGLITALMIWLRFEWLALQLVSVLPCLAMLRLSPSVVESPDWLVARGRLEDVEAVLIRAATLNDENLMELRQRWKRTRRELEQDKSHVIPHRGCSEKLFLRGSGRNSVILYYIWTIEMFGSQAGSLRIHSLGFYPAAMLALGAALTIPAQLAAIVSAGRIGRRNAQAGALGCAAVASVAAATISDEDVISSMAALQLANIGVNASSFINTLYTAEVYPTVLRCSGLGLCTAFSMAASIITQLIFYKGLIPISWLLSAVVSLLCLGGAVLVLKLPDTIEETTLPDV